MVFMQPLLSAIMIVKNEEKNLPRCLKSLQGVCDEICVVDTGSTDRTVEIAKEFGAKVSIFSWNGNESDARNVSARMATGCWMFTVDADEEISKELAEELRMKLPMVETECGIQSLSVIWRNHYGDGSTSQTRITRITRNFEDFEFDGNIHPVANYRSPVLALKGFLDHYGYIWTPEQKKKKSAHMIEHLAKYVEGDSPDFARLCQYLTYLMVSEREEEFWKRFEQIRNHPQSQRVEELYWRQTLANVLLHFSEKDDFFSGKFFAEEILVAHPNFVGALFYLLQDAVRRRDWNETSSYAKKVLESLEKPVEFANIVFPEVQKPTAQAWLWLAKIIHKQLPLVLPDALIQSRVVHILLFAHEQSKFSCENADFARLLKFHQTLREEENLPELNLIKMTEVVQDARKASRSANHLLASLILIEVFRRMGNISQSLTVLSEILDMYQDHRWLAMAHRKPEQILFRFYEEILHQP